MLKGPKLQMVRTYKEGQNNTHRICDITKNVKCTVYLPQQSTYVLTQNKVQRKYSTQVRLPIANQGYKRRRTIKQTDTVVRTQSTGPRPTNNKGRPQRLSSRRYLLEHVGRELVASPSTTPSKRAHIWTLTLTTQYLVCQKLISFTMV